MAVVTGTNSGFVTTSPVDNPNGSSNSVDNYTVVTKHTTPSNVNKITEIGWWCDNATQEINFEVGLYAADGSSGKAGTLLYSSSTNAKGTTSGWKKVTVSWDISPNTIYWIGFQLDNTTPNTDIDISSATGTYGYVSPSTTLPSPYTNTTTFSGDIWALYALVTNQVNSNSNFLQLF